MCLWCAEGAQEGSLEEQASVEISTSLLAACQAEAKKCILLAQRKQGEMGTSDGTDPQTFQVLQGTPLPGRRGRPSPSLSMQPGQTRTGPADEWHATELAGLPSACMLGDCPWQGCWPGLSWSWARFRCSRAPRRVGGLRSAAGAGAVGRARGAGTSLAAMSSSSWRP